jgi:hypothetical protein
MFLVGLAPFLPVVPLPSLVLLIPSRVGARIATSPFGQIATFLVASLQSLCFQARPALCFVTLVEVSSRFLGPAGVTEPTHYHWTLSHVC